MNHIQVGKTLIEKKGVPRRFICKYSDVPCTEDGWVTDLQYLPINYDMMLLSVDGRKKPVPAWWTGDEWEGLRFKKEYQVNAWKRMPEYD